MDLLKEGKLQLSAISLTANSGKGKSTFINHFKEYCSTKQVETVLIDFSVYSITSEFELINYMYEQLCPIFGETYFKNYLEQLNIIRESKLSQTIFKDINMVNTSVGSVEVTNSNTNTISFSLITNAFFKDIDNLPRKIVLFFDTLDKANKEITEIIINKILINRKNSSYFTFVASQKKIFEDTVSERYKIYNYSLPDKYFIEDYMKYAKEIKIILPSPNDLQKIVNCWDGDPFYISIVLEPFRGN